MKLLVDIPKEFEQHFQVDRFEDSLHRLSADAHLLAGLYEQETAVMLIKSFKSAVPVPTHGRLIDADALAEKIDGIWDCNDMVFRPNDKICKIPEDCKGCKWAQTKNFIKRMVENAPTIIPAEEDMA